MLFSCSTVFTQITNSYSFRIKDFYESTFFRIRQVSQIHSRWRTWGNVPIGRGDSPIDCSYFIVFLFENLSYIFYSALVLADCRMDKPRFRDCFKFHSLPVAERKSLNLPPRTRMKIQCPDCIFVFDKITFVGTS